MTESAENNTESANIEPEESPVSINLEAFTGLDDFAAVKDSMILSSKSNLATFDGENAPIFEEAGLPSSKDLGESLPQFGKNSSGNNLREIKPEGLERFKTPSIRADQYLLRKAQINRAIFDEAGQIVPRKRGEAPAANSIESLATILNDSGKLKSIESKYRFDESKTIIEITDDGATRTRVVEDGKEVTKFGADGKPTSREVTSKDGSTRKMVELAPDDRLKVGTDGDGITTVEFKSTRDDRVTTIKVGINGLPTQRLIEVPSGRIETAYDSRGKPEVEKNTFYNDQGSIFLRDRLTAESYNQEIFDDEGNLVVSVDDNGKYALTNEKLKDGTTVNLVENHSAGSKNTIVQRPDGSTMQLSYDGLFRSSVKMTNPDGSFIESTDDGTNLSRKSQDKAGNWVSSTRDKQTGIDKKKYGKGGKTYDVTVTKPV